MAEIPKSRLLTNLITIKFAQKSQLSDNYAPLLGLMWLSLIYTCDRLQWCNVRSLSPYCFLIPF
jgi:hypothetical protein